MARVTGIPLAKVRLWLAGHVEEDVLPQSLQATLLGALGVRGDTLRNDLVHAWDVREPLFGEGSSAWAALETVISAFGGKAEVSYIAEEADPFFSLRPVTLYLLRFPSFHALLRVHCSLLRPSRFSPERITGLSWAPGNFGVLLDTPEYLSVLRAEIGAKPLQRLLSLTSEPARWDMLIQAAQKAEVRPEVMLKLLTAYTSRRLPASAPTGVENAAAADSPPPTEQECDVRASAA
jgi:hypothetical protein